MIESVTLFDAPALVESLQARGLKIGVATSVRRALWEVAEVYPTPRNPLLPLTEAQRELLALFRSRS